MRKRKLYLDRRQSDDHERWLVSYSDFITLLFAFFVVMYAISSLNAGKYQAVSESLLSAFRIAGLPLPLRAPPEASGVLKPALPLHRAVPTPPAAVPVSPPVAAPVAAQPAPSLTVLRLQRAAQARRRREAKMRAIARDILGVLGDMARTGKVRITQSTRGIAVQINAKVLFATGQARLHPHSEQVLAKVGRVLSGVHYAIQVEGFTDNVPISTALYPSNWELSSARASSVVRVFIANGVAASRLSVIGYGPNRPIASNATPQGRARNRRVTVVVLARAPGHRTEIPVNAAVAAGPQAKGK